jgi:hypothetical protein
VVDSVKLFSFCLCGFCFMVLALSFGSSALDMDFPGEMARFIVLLFALI